MTWDGTHRPGCITAARCDCDKIQAPPSSETGATAEAAAREIMSELYASGADFGCLGPGTGEGRAAEVVEPILRRILLAAKRSAHLEDARAGCGYCGGEGKWSAALGYDPAPIKDAERRRWVHVKVGIGSEDYYVAYCARPEVWDALSLTGAK